MIAELELDGPHWRFALAFYGRPGIQDACLKLQDETGLDIVLLIAALHAAIATGRLPSRAALASAFAGISDWRDASVLPLRNARRALKGLRSDVPDSIREVFRNRIKVLELEAERIELAALAARLRGDGTPSPPVARERLHDLISDVLAAQGLAPPGAGLADAVATVAGAALSVRP